MKKPKLTTEQVFRALIRKEIKRLLEAEEPTQTAPVEKKPEAKPQPKPEPKPEEEPEAPEADSEDEEGLNSDFDSALSTFIGKLKSSTETVSSDDLIDIMTRVMESFSSSSEDRLYILRAIKQNTVH